MNKDYTYSSLKIRLSTCQIFAHSHTAYIQQANYIVKTKPLLFKKVINENSWPVTAVGKYVKFTDTCLSTFNKAIENHV